MYVISVDVETTGPDPSVHNLLSFAAVVMDVESKEVKSSMKVHIRQEPADLVWDESTKTFWDTIPEQRDGILATIAWDNLSVRLEKAMHDFRDLCLEANKIDPQVPIIFDTAGFDASFINKALSVCGLRMLTLMFGENDYRPILDTTSYHRGIAGMSYKDGIWGNEKAACEALGQPDLLASNPYKANHDPLVDACSIAWEHCTLMQAVKKAQVSRKRVKESIN